MPDQTAKIAAWLDADGRHVWQGHDCVDGPAMSMLPWPNWHVEPTLRSPLGEVRPSIHCTRCGAHDIAEIESVPDA